MNGKRVLFVDDEAPIRFQLSKQLNRAGFDTTTAADGEAALAAMAAESFDAVVLDVIMPGLDGFEVCRRLKANPRTAGVPVIFLSASSNGDFRRRAFQVGAADFLAKPFQIQQLPAYIQACCRRYEEPATAAGRIVSVVGAGQSSGAVEMAIRLAETAALQGPTSAMLIDLELPASRIGAKLQLSGGPNMRGLLQDSGEAISYEAIARVAQRYHGALDVLPAPFSPSLLVQSDPIPQRLEEVLDILTERGYQVIIHLGSKVDELTLTAMKRSETIWLTADEANMETEKLLATITAAGIARDRLSPARLSAGAGELPARFRVPTRITDPVTGQWATAA